VIREDSIASQDQGPTARGSTLVSATRRTTATKRYGGLSNTCRRSMDGPAARCDGEVFRDGLLQQGCIARVPEIVEGTDGLHRRLAPRRRDPTGDHEVADRQYAERPVIFPDVQLENRTGDPGSFICISGSRFFLAQGARCQCLGVQADRVNLNHPKQQRTMCRSCRRAARWIADDTGSRRRWIGGAIAEKSPSLLRGREACRQTSQPITHI
jgi:hypothetical protein